jgi:hypothetical protein
VFGTELGWELALENVGRKTSTIERVTIDCLFSTIFASFVLPAYDGVAIGCFCEISFVEYALDRSRLDSDQSMKRLTLDTCLLVHGFLLIRVPVISDVRDLFDMQDVKNVTPRMRTQPQL